MPGTAGLMSSETRCAFIRSSNPKARFCDVSHGGRANDLLTAPHLDGARRAEETSSEDAARDWSVAAAVEETPELPSLSRGT